MKSCRASSSRVRCSTDLRYLSALLAAAATARLSAVIAARSLAMSARLKANDRTNAKAPISSASSTAAADNWEALVRHTRRNVPPDPMTISRSGHQAAIRLMRPERRNLLRCNNDDPALDPWRIGRLAKGAWPSESTTAES